MPTEADITLTHQQGWGDKAKKDVDSWKKNVHRNEKTNTEMHMGSRNNVVLQALLYSDHTEAYPLATAVQRLYFQALNQDPILPSVISALNWNIRD